MHALVLLGAGIHMPMDPNRGAVVIIVCSIPHSDGIFNASILQPSMLHNPIHQQSCMEFVWAYLLEISIGCRNFPLYRFFTAHIVVRSLPIHVYILLVIYVSLCILCCHHVLSVRLLPSKCRT